MLSRILCHHCGGDLVIFVAVWMKIKENVNANNLICIIYRAFIFCFIHFTLLFRAAAAVWARRHSLMAALNNRVCVIFSSFFVGNLKLCHPVFLSGVVPSE
jgi:hypothetical protein